MVAKRALVGIFDSNMKITTESCVRILTEDLKRKYGAEHEENWKLSVVEMNGVFRLYLITLNNHPLPESVNDAKEWIIAYVCGFIAGQTCKPALDEV